MAPIESGPIIITGASGGIGLALTEYLVKSGFGNLVCQYRTSSDRLLDVFAGAGIDGHRRVVQADLTDEEAVTRFRGVVESEYGAPYALINLAGGTSNCLSWKLSVDEFRRVFDQNVLTTFLMCREFAPGMRKCGCGRIINTSSVVAFKGVAGAAHYCAAKAAIIGFSKAIALELAPKNVCVSVIALGYFEYGMIEKVPTSLRAEMLRTIPAQRFGSVADIGGLISFLLGEGGAYTNGQVYHLNGGLYS